MRSEQRFDAQASQGTILQLNSPEAVKTFGIAVMDVYLPCVFADGYSNDTLLTSGTQFFRGELAETGDYLVIVQSSAGGDSYDLDVVIQNVEPGPQS